MAKSRGKLSMAERFGKVPDYTEQLSFQFKKTDYTILVEVVLGKPFNIYRVRLVKLNKNGQIASANKKFQPFEREDKSQFEVKIIKLLKHNLSKHKATGKGGKVIKEVRHNVMYVEG